MEERRPPPPALLDPLGARALQPAWLGGPSVRSGRRCSTPFPSAPDPRSWSPLTPASPGHTPRTGHAPPRNGMLHFCSVPQQRPGIARGSSSTTNSQSRQEEAAWGRNRPARGSACVRLAVRGQVDRQIFPHQSPKPQQHSASRLTVKRSGLGVSPRRLGVGTWYVCCRNTGSEISGS